MKIIITVSININKKILQFNNRVRILQLQGNSHNKPLKNQLILMTKIEHNKINR